MLLSLAASRWHGNRAPSVCCVSLPHYRCVSSWNTTVSMAIGDTILRVERINGYMTELMEISVEAPKLRVVFIPGNPGVIPFYKSYLEALSQFFGGKATITGLGYVGHTCKDWEKAKLFSLDEQVEHKVHYVQDFVADEKIPLVLVGHSIGAHMALCIFKRFPDKIQHVVALYPFLATNEKSSFQSFLKWSLRQGFLCEALAYFASFMGKLPKKISRGFLRSAFGRSWSQFSVDVACQYLLQYSMVRNITYLGMTEFKKLQRHPDWEFLKEREKKISILFGVDDHWGPLTLFEEMTGRAPSLDVEIEREGHDHAFCCTDDGSYWVAAFCAKTIKKILPKLEPALASAKAPD